MEFTDIKKKQKQYLDAFQRHKAGRMSEEELRVYGKEYRLMVEIYKSNGSG